MSPLTRNSLVISEIEARQKDLADKMTSKIADLEEQIGTLEMFLANSETQICCCIYYSCSGTEHVLYRLFSRHQEHELENIMYRLIQMCVE